MSTGFPVIALLLTFILLFPSCMTFQSGESGYGNDPVFSASSLPEEQYRALFDDFSSYSGSVALGISGPSENREKAIGKATEEALRYLAFNRGLAMEVRYSRSVNTSAGLNRFGTMSGGGTSDRLMDECASLMKIEKITWYGGRIGAAVFASVPGMERVDVPSDWRTRIPVKDGWNFAAASVSSSGKTMQDAIEGAIFRAAQYLLDADTGSVSVDVTLESTHKDGYENDTFQISGNRFSSFTVFALDYDSVSKQVYALVGSKNR